MCESESGFRFESGFRAFWAGFGFGFRARIKKSGFGFKKKRVDSDWNPDSGFLVPITSLQIFILLSLLQLSYIDCGGFESGFGFKAVGFGFGFKKLGFGFKKNKVDLDSGGFGFRTAVFGFKMLGFAHH